MEQALIGVTSNFFVTDSDENGSSLLPMFGEKVKFTQPQLTVHDEYDWLLESDEEEAPTSDWFSMHYESQSFAETNTVKHNGTAPSEPSLSEFDSGWLRRQVEQIGPNGAGMSVNDLSTTLFDSLTSSQPNDALQEEVRSMNNY